VHNFLLPLFFLVKPTVSFIHSDSSCKKFYGNWDLYHDQTLRCWLQGMVLHYRDFSCHDLHSVNPCEDGSRLVHLKGTCGETYCKVYTDTSGKHCPNGWVSHQGKCKDAEDPTSCGPTYGQRLHADIFGDYFCKCDRSLGFVEYENSCYLEYLRGPCKIGEQIVAGDKGTQCVKNNCSDGKILWSDGECYDYELSGTVAMKHTEEEKLNGYYRVSLIPLNTFDNCHAKDSSGKCLLKVPLPEIPEPTKLELLNMFQSIFYEHQKNSSDLRLLEQTETVQKFFFKPK